MKYLGPCHLTRLLEPELLSSAPSGVIYLSLTKHNLCMTPLICSTQNKLKPCLQVNYLGPYHLTRLLEPQLLSSAPSRVVNVSSIMHRSGSVHSDANSFLRDWSKGSQYSNTKLANVLFAYEAQRRLGPRGVQVGLCFLACSSTYSIVVCSQCILYCVIGSCQQGTCLQASVWEPLFSSALRSVL